MTAAGGRLEGARAVVTGASRGIGRAIAERYAAEGAEVVCAARNETELRRCVDSISAAGGRAVAVAVDVTDDESVARFGHCVLDRFGPPDVLVNNAGTMRIGGFAEVDIAAWRDVFDVNIFGAVRITKSFLPAMVLRRAGSVLNIASTAGKYGSVNQASYNASKHALVGLTRCLALEAAPAGIRVNAICPGFVNTDIIEDNIDELATAFALPREQVVPTLLARVPIGRLLEPGEIAELAVYLAAPGSEGMTGQAITLAGGLILI